MRYFVVYLLTLITVCCSVSCTTIDQPEKLIAKNEYCDRYFAYLLCVSDVTGNGEIDFMYFSDTNDVFMLAPDIDQQIKAQLVLHDCVQVMNENLRVIASKLLYIDQNTSVLQKAYLKSQLIIAYSRYMGDVNRCHHGTYEASSAKDDFGDEEFDKP